MRKRRNKKNSQQHELVCQEVLKDEISITELKINRFLSGKATENEVRQFRLWLDVPENNASFQQYKKIYHATAGFRPDGSHVEKAWSRYSVYMRRSKRSVIRLWISYSAAAVLLAFVVWLCLPSGQDGIPKNPLSENASTQLSGGVRLVRQDGSTLNILELDHQQLEPGVLVDPEGRSIDYMNLEPASATISYSTIYVSAGERFTVTLSDGTRVWLNSGSSLKYPDRFSSGERSVELSGEAYFEVENHPGRPFTVTTHDMRIEVLGTVFNIQDFREEQSAVMTLVSGSVRISSYGQSLTVSPNEQVTWQDGKLTRTTIDPNIYTAWKDGIMILENVSFEELLHRMGRWYGKMIIPEISVSPHERFKGRFDKEDLETALQTLALNLGLKFSVEGDTVTLHQ